MAAITVGLLGGAGGASASKAHKQVRYVRLVVGQGFYVDNDPSGQSGGDLFGSTGDLEHNGHKVGTFSSACTASSAEVGQCQATLAWNSGDRVQLAGKLDLQEAQNRFSIVGGTRKYKKARGDATVTRLDDQGQTQRIKLRILR
jgi:hypothetical protein